jgi:hypothetical protein
VRQESRCGGERGAQTLDGVTRKPRFQYGALGGELEPPQAQGVSDHADAGEAHGGGGKGRVKADAECWEGEAGGEGDEEQVVAEGPGRFWGPDTATATKRFLGSSFNY